MKFFKIEKKEWFYFDINDRILIYNLIFEKLKNEWVKDFTLNVLSDHVHLVMNYDDDKLTEIIRKIKWWVSFQFTKLKKFSEKWNWRQNKVWARWFSKTYLDSEEHFKKAINYVKNNHKKHEVEDILDFVDKRDNDN